MKRIPLMFLIAVIAATTNAQSVITLQHGATTTLFTTLDSAIAKVQNGDAIYLPGGVIPGAVFVTVTKRVSIFGAGYRSDSSATTQPTTIVSVMTFNAGSEGSLLTGVIMPEYTGAGVNIEAANVSVTRCNIANIIDIGASGAILEENIISGSIEADLQLTHPTNVLIRKNVIYATLLTPTNWYVVNNVFIDWNRSFSKDGSNCTFTNNIILNDFGFLTTPGTGLTFTNNLFTTDAGIAGNKTQVIDSIFTKYSRGAQWDITQNFKLKTGCKGIKAGTDGTDMGIYGTASPFKNGAFPFNPHIQSVSIPASTGPDGKLNISITVAAQNQ